VINYLSNPKSFAQVEYLNGALAQPTVSIAHNYEDYEIRLQTFFDEQALLDEE
jgi:hypothetical protein